MRGNGVNGTSDCMYRVQDAKRDLSVLGAYLVLGRRQRATELEHGSWIVRKLHVAALHDWPQIASATEGIGGLLMGIE